MSDDLGTGSTVTGENGRKWVLGEQLAYGGKEGCQDPRCTRRGSHQREDGSWEMGECIGWHCPTCDEPCSSMGHRCPKAPVLG